jgi:hypothetical protein
MLMLLLGMSLSSPVFAAVLICYHNLLLLLLALERYLERGLFEFL